MEKGKINQCCGTVEGTPHIFECEYGALKWQNQEDGQTIGRLTSRITELERQVSDLTADLAKWKHLESRTVEMEVFTSGVCRKLYKLGGLWSVGDDASDSSYEGVLAAFDTINDK